MADDLDPNDEQGPRMIVMHLYDLETGEYAGSQRIAEGEELPDGATLVDPPASEPGYALFWNGDGWDQLPIQN